MEPNKTLNSARRRFDKTPHVCVKAELLSAKNANDELPNVLKRRFEVKFGSVRMSKPWFSSPCAFTMQYQQRLFSALLGRNRHAEGEWILLSAPPRASTLLDRLLRREPRHDTQEVAAFCREIHTTLNTMPGITAIRWYFSGPRTQTPGVGSPDELPWS